MSGARDKNEDLFREVNERIEALNESFESILPVGEWVCECPNETCADLVELSVAEYEAIRQHPNRFAVLPGHEALDVEVVVERHERYLVVEKIAHGGAVARRHDPRSAR